MSMTDLAGLRARVEAAIHCNKSMFWDVAKALNIPLGEMWGTDPTTLGALIDGRAWESAALCIARYAEPTLDLGMNWRPDGTVSGSARWQGEAMDTAVGRSVSRNADMAGAVILLALLSALEASHDR